MVLGYLRSVKHIKQFKKGKILATQIENILPIGSKWKTWLFILAINLRFFLYFYLFIYLFIYLFFVYLSVRVHCKPACVSVSMSFFPCLKICQFLFLCVCLFVWLLFAKSLYFYYFYFWLYNIIFIFINRQPSFISFLHPFIRGEFKTLGLSSMVYS